jgi:hypothetical protein
MVCSCDYSAGSGLSFSCAIRLEIWVRLVIGMSSVFAGAGVDYFRMLFGGICLGAWCACLGLSCPCGGLGLSFEFSLSRSVIPLLLP